jgi:hypothetical protein
MVVEDKAKINAHKVIDDLEVQLKKTGSYFDIRT